MGPRAQTLSETAEREFLRYKKVTADGRPLELEPSDLYDVLNLDQRADRILPNGWCMLPPKQTCSRGNACLTCDKFVTDVTHRDELRQQCDGTVKLIDRRKQTFLARYGTAMPEENVWLAERSAEQSALERILVVLDSPAANDGEAVRGHHRPREGSMSEHLKAAARRRREAEARATRALGAMSRQGEAVTFVAVARRAAVSTDFLYRHPTLRAEVVDLRRATSGRPSPNPPEPVPVAPDTSSAVRSLAAQLKELRARHRDELARLQKALASAHGENLLLRRQLGDKVTDA